MDNGSPNVPNFARLSFHQQHKKRYFPPKNSIIFTVHLGVKEKGLRLTCDEKRTRDDTHERILIRFDMRQEKSSRFVRFNL